MVAYINAFQNSKFIKFLTLNSACISILHCAAHKGGSKSNPTLSESTWFTPENYCAHWDMFSLSFYRPMKQELTHTYPIWLLASQCQLSRIKWQSKTLPLKHFFSENTGIVWDKRQTIWIYLKFLNTWEWLERCKQPEEWRIANTLLTFLNNSDFDTNGPRMSWQNWHSSIDL